MNEGIKIHTLEDTSKYRSALYYFCVWQAQVSLFEEKKKNNEQYDEKKYEYACAQLEQFRTELENCKANLDFKDGLAFMNDAEFDGFSIQNGKLIARVDNETIFNVLDPWYYGFPITANHRQFEVAHYIICMVEAETKKSIYPADL